MNIKHLCILAMLCGSQPVLATDFDFNGTFINDNDVATFNFSLGVDSTVTLFSSSWDDGGFDPILAIFDSNGTLIFQQDDGNNVGTTSSNGVAYTHGDWDSYFSQTLTAGNYTASITQFDNFALGPNLSNGFTYDANPNFISDVCNNSKFCGRGPDWTFHILNAAQATNANVPEPTSLALLSMAAMGIAATRRRKIA